VKPVLRRRPSAALVISLVALFLSLGGVSYGVATGFIDSREIKNNTVRSKDLKNNDIRTLDLRNNEVRGVDLRNSTIQGRDVALNTLGTDDINESRLGQVPSAAQAGRASLATTAMTLGSLPQLAPVDVAKGAAPATLFSLGPLTVAGACVDDAGGTRAEVRVQTTAAGASAGGDTASDASLGPGDGPLAVAGVTAAAGSDALLSSPVVAAEAGNTLSVSGVMSLEADTAGAGSCRFHGHLSLTGLAIPAG